jgi:mannose/fructose/N-acetylgalactosamine-specific phosphotransferase system component IIC
MGGKHMWKTLILGCLCTVVLYFIIALYPITFFPIFLIGIGIIIVLLAIENKQEKSIERKKEP